MPDGFVIDNASDAVLATGADGTALRFDAVALVRGADLAEYLASGWVNGLNETSITPLRGQWHAGRRGPASAKGWEFRIAIVQADSGATYRFIFANEVRDLRPQEGRAGTVASFRKLNATESAGLRPLRVRVVAVKPGDTEQGLARQMVGIDRPLELFRALNELTPGQKLAPGRRVKLVQD